MITEPIASPEDALNSLYGSGGHRSRHEVVLLGRFAREIADRLHLRTFDTSGFGGVEEALDAFRKETGL